MSFWHQTPTTAKAGNVCFCSPFNNADFKAGPALQSSYETSCAERSYLQLLREDEQHKVSANQLPHLLLGPRNPKSLREQEAGEKGKQTLEGHSHLPHNHLLFPGPAPHEGQWEMALPSFRNTQGEK